MRHGSTRFARRANAYGCVCQWLWETAAGIEAAAPGFRSILMRPVPDKRLGSLEAEYRSAVGLIRSAWRYEGDKWIWEFTVPEGASATVVLPGQTEGKEYGPGSYTVEK